MILIDDLFDRLVLHLKRSRRERPDDESINRSGKKAGSRNLRDNQHEFDFFRHANHFVVNRSMFIQHRGNIINNFVAGKVAHHALLERIMLYADLDATMDSSARFPPPLCHPGTRLKIRDKLFSWLLNPERGQNMMWLHGPAGTGKSAVAQTFAERCAGVGRLGASFFFPRSNDRNNPDTVIPTLVHQLAVCLPRYRALVAAQLANDPQGLLRKTRRTQFRKLIVEPLSQIQNQRWNRIRNPFVIVLDGLDECRGEDAQREIIEMINEVVGLKKKFPLVWLVCSRPEPHLKYLFSRVDFTVNCAREKLAIDAESIADVDFCLRDGLVGIKAHLSDVTTSTWPPEEQVAELSGLPLVISVLLQPRSGILGIRTGTSNPLEALDALYTAILQDVPEEGLCNFLCIDQATFYRAFRKLHSVIDVPSPEAALQRHLRFYHTSFQDYLCNPNRSGKFVVEEGDIYLSYAKLCLSWYKNDLELFHTTDGPMFNEEHEHGVLPGLKWVSDDNRQMSSAIATHAEQHCWYACSVSDEWNEALLSQIHDFDFRNIQADASNFYSRSFLNTLMTESCGGVVH